MKQTKTELPEGSVLVKNAYLVREIERPPSLTTHL